MFNSFEVYCISNNCFELIDQFYACPYILWRNSYVCVSISVLIVCHIDSFIFFRIVYVLCLLFLISQNLTSMFASSFFLPSQDTHWLLEDAALKQGVGSTYILNTCFTCYKQLSIMSIVDANDLLGTIDERQWWLEILRKTASDFWDSVGEIIVKLLFT